MHIDWAALGTVFGVSLVSTIGLVGLFTLGIVGLAERESPEAGSGSTEGSAALARTGAYLCFALCAAAVTYGIYLVVA